MLQMVKRFAALVALSASVVGCNTLDIKGLFVPTSDLIGTRFEQSMAKNGNKPVASIAAEQEYLFYVCTDPHIADTAHNLTIFNDALRNDSEALFGLVLGDLSDRRGNHPRYVEAIAFDAQRHSHNHPIFNVLGNHDLYFDGWEKYLELVGPSVYWFDVEFAGGKDLFLVLDSATGTLGREQTQWMKGFLAEHRHKYRHCIISKHTNLFYADTSQNTSGNMPIEECVALMDLWSEYDVTLVLQGHDHTREDLTYGGVRYTIVGTLRDGCKAPEYLKITVGPNGVDFAWVVLH